MGALDYYIQLIPSLSCSVARLASGFYAASVSSSVSGSTSTASPSSSNRALAASLSSTHSASRFRVAESVWRSRLAVHCTTFSVPERVLQLAHLVQPTLTLLLGALQLLPLGLPGSRHRVEHHAGVGWDDERLRGDDAVSVGDGEQHRLDGNGTPRDPRRSGVRLRFRVGPLGLADHVGKGRDSSLDLLDLPRDQGQRLARLADDALAGRHLSASTSAWSAGGW